MWFYYRTLISVITANVGAIGVVKDISEHVQKVAQDRPSIDALEPIVKKMGLSTFNKHSFSTLSPLSTQIDRISEGNVIEPIFSDSEEKHASNKGKTAGAAKIATT